jgi:hypothetical protein
MICQFFVIRQQREQLMIDNLFIFLTEEGAADD